jgi:hypothetical protein
MSPHAHLAEAVLFDTNTLNAGHRVRGAGSGIEISVMGPLHMPQLQSRVELVSREMIGDQIGAS